MSITIASATARIVRQLPEAEISLDAALLASARLMESMLLARQAEGMQTFTAQTALMRLAKTQRSLIETQNDMIRVHQELLEVGREIRMMPDEGDSCPPTGTLADTQPVRRVA